MERKWNLDTGFVVKGFRCLWPLTRADRIIVIFNPYYIIYISTDKSHKYYH